MRNLRQGLSQNIQAIRNFTRNMRTRMIPEPDYTPRPSYSLVCSCGKRTNIIWTPKDARYTPIDSHWKCTFESGWTCGRRGHEQKSYAELKLNKEGLVDG